MFKVSVLIVFVLVVGVILVGLIGQGPAPMVSEAQAVEPVASYKAGYDQVIPPADMWEIQFGQSSPVARAKQESARVQAVIDYISEHRRFPPRTVPFDSAQQVVMDYIRIYNRVPTSAGQVGSPRQAVLDYIRIHHAMPPHPAPVDPAIQDVMDYIRKYNKVPRSAAALD